LGFGYSKFEKERQIRKRGDESKHGFPGDLTLYTAWA